MEYLRRSALQKPSTVTVKTANRPIATAKAVTRIHVRVKAAVRDRVDMKIRKGSS